MAEIRTVSLGKASADSPDLGAKNACVLWHGIPPIRVKFNGNEIARLHIPSFIGMRA
jgi:hypothetical protein